MDEIKVRGIDPAALKKVDSLAKKNRISRNEFLKRQIESLAVINELKFMENRFEYTMNQMAKIVELNTKALDKNSKMMEEMLD